MPQFNKAALYQSVRRFFIPFFRKEVYQMDFLQTLFASGALNWEQFQNAVKKAGFEIVNAAGGAYVPKATVDGLNGQITTLTGQLNTANQKLEGYDPNWKQQAEDAKKQLDAQKFEFAIDRALAGSGARSAKAVRGLLDQTKLTLADDGELIGLDKQLEALRKGEDTAFLFEPAQKPSTGMSHQGGSEGTPNLKEEANAALRSLLGKQ